MPFQGGEAYELLQNEVAEDRLARKLAVEGLARNAQRPQFSPFQSPASSTWREPEVMRNDILIWRLRIHGARILDIWDIMFTCLQQLHLRSHFDLL